MMRRLAAGERLTDLCREFGISRKTGSKFKARFDRLGVAGLEDVSRAPHVIPHKTPPELMELIIAARRERPTWGPRKIKDVLERRLGHDLPSHSAIGTALEKAGLVTPRKRRHSYTAEPSQLSEATAPNTIWCIDYKGQFRLGDRTYCYPLTITDQHSRFLLTCHSLRNVQTVGARPAFERAFREYGLPRAIRTDNGVPFATQAIHGLSQLNVWWIRLGIQHQRILPAHPQQNGAHERMHKTLKAGAIRPPRATLPAQQRAFDTFRQEYNEVRPHATLHGHTPASIYRSSPRPYPRRLPPVEYPGHYLVKRITSGGTFRFGRRLLFLATPHEGYDVGLDEVEDGVWSIYFCNVLVARFDERDHVIRS